jgi:hypothetical protein
MRTFVALAAGAIAVAVPETAAAHAVFGATGFSGGLLHPIAVPSHGVAVGRLAC